MDREFKYKIGQTLKDLITGLEGVVMVRAEYFSGCHHYGLSVRSLSKDGKVPEWEWIDESRLEPVVNKPIVRFAERSGPTSAPGHNPPRMG